MPLKTQILLKFAESAKKIIGVMIVFSMFALASIAFAQQSKDSKSPPTPEQLRAAIGPDLSGFASIEGGRIDLGNLGQVAVVDGAGSVMRTKGKVDKLEHDTLLFAGDRVQLQAGARAVIRLNDARFEKNQSVVTLFGNSILVVEEAKADGPENLRDVNLVLETGEMRAQVPPASDPVLPTFHVKLPTSQVNLKTGDAWIHLEKVNGKLHSRVVMIEGSGTLLTERSVDGKKDFVDIPMHQSAEFIQANVPPGATVGVYQQLIEKGNFTEPADVEASEITKIVKLSNVTGALKSQQRAAQATHHLNERKRLAAERSKEALAIKKAAKARVIEASAHLCQAPGGQFNQCAWTCAGNNPKTAKTCRTDLAGVSCLRTICRADGEWKEETRLPASQSDLCPAQGSAVHECGNYW